MLQAIKTDDKMDKQFFDNIKTLLTELSLEFDNYISNSDKFANKLFIAVTELYLSENDKLKEIKLDLLENQIECNNEKLKLVLKNLSYFNNFISNNEFKLFIDKLHDFNRHFIELDEIWKTIDWRYFYDVFNNQLLIYSKKRSLLNSTNISEIKSITEKLNEFINTKSRKDYEKLLVKEIKSLKNEISILINHLDFVHLFSLLHKEITSSLTKSLEIQWNELITKSEISKTDSIVLSLILRLSIENQLKSHPIILASTSPIKMVGKMFEKLQENGIYILEKSDIQRYKKPLDEVIHGAKENLTRSELIEIKEYFKSLLATQHLSLF